MNFHTYKQTKKKTESVYLHITTPTVRRVDQVNLQFSLTLLNGKCYLPPPLGVAEKGNGK